MTGVDGAFQCGPGITDTRPPAPPSTSLRLFDLASDEVPDGVGGDGHLVFVGNVGDDLVLQFFFGVSFSLPTAGVVGVFSGERVGHEALLGSVDIGLGQSSPCWQGTRRLPRGLSLRTAGGRAGSPASPRRWVGGPRSVLGGEDHVEHPVFELLHLGRPFLGGWFRVGDAPVHRRRLGSPRPALAQASMPPSRFSASKSPGMCTASEFVSTPPAKPSVRCLGAAVPRCRGAAVPCAEGRSKWCEGHLLVDLPDRHRRRVLEELALPGIALVPQFDPGDADTLLVCCERLGVEGLCVPGGVQNARPWRLLKCARNRVGAVRLRKHDLLVRRGHPVLQRLDHRGAGPAGHLRRPDGCRGVPGAGGVAAADRGEG